MAAQRQYATAGAFRTALEARLNERARRDGVDLHRLRRQVAFDRLLARMFDPSQPRRDGWVLKGGYALEMRFHTARSTKDLDLTVRSVQGSAGDSISLRERLQLAASIELPDFFTFIVSEAMAELNQAPEGGARFPVDARLDGRTFVKFHVDLGVGDEVLEPLERRGRRLARIRRHPCRRRAGALGGAALGGEVSRVHASTRDAEQPRAGSS